MNINVPILRIGVATGLVFFQLLAGALIFFIGMRGFESRFSLALDEIERAALFSQEQLSMAQRRMREWRVLEPVPAWQPGAEAGAIELPASLTPDLHAAYFNLLEQQLRGGSAGLRDLRVRTERLRAELQSAHLDLSQHALAFGLVLLLSTAVLGLWVLSELEAPGPQEDLLAGAGSGTRPAAAPWWRGLSRRLSPRLRRSASTAPASGVGAASMQPWTEPGLSESEAFRAEWRRACQLMGELQQSVQGSARHVEQARILSAGLGQQAAHCLSLMAEIVTEMRGLNATVAQVRDLLLKVDHLAFETHALAAHAALGMAQSGRPDGTALLGAEVQALAQRCAEAARDVKRSMTEAVDRIEQRGVQVFGAAEALSEILGSVERLAQMTADVSFAGLVEGQSLERLGQALQGLEARRGSGARPPP